MLISEVLQHRFALTMPILILFMTVFQSCRQGQDDLQKAERNRVYSQYKFAYLSVLPKPET